MAQIAIRTPETRTIQADTGKLKVFYKRKGTMYFFIIPNRGKNDMELQCLARKIGRSEVVKFHKI